MTRKRGRPAGSDKVRTTLRIDKATVDRFRASGPGWQTRMNAALGWLDETDALIEEAEAMQSCYKRMLRDPDCPAPVQSDT